MKEAMNLKESKKEHTYGRVCREEREGRDDATILYFQKQEKEKKKHVILMIFRASWLNLTSSPTVGVLQLFSC